MSHRFKDKSRILSCNDAACQTRAVEHAVYPDKSRVALKHDENNIQKSSTLSHPRRSLGDNMYAAAGATPCNVKDTVCLRRICHRRCTSHRQICCANIDTCSRLNAGLVSRRQITLAPLLALGVAVLVPAQADAVGIPNVLSQSLKKQLGTVFPILFRTGGGHCTFKLV